MTQQAKDALNTAHLIENDIKTIMTTTKRKPRKIREAQDVSELLNADLLTVSEVGMILRVDDATVRRWVKNGVLEAVTLPHRGNRECYRIKRETLNRVLR